MGQIPKVRCNKRCDGCPVLPLSKNQYTNIVQTLTSSTKPEDVELFSKFLNMEVYAVFCLQEQQTCLFEVKK